MSAWIEKRGDRYRIRWREPDGTKRSATRRTHAEARAKKAEVEDALYRGVYVDKATRDMAFGDYVVEILEGEPLEASTMYQHRRVFLRWIEPTLGNVPIGDIDASVLRRFFAGMRADGASESSVARVRATMTKYFRRAHQEGILPRNPLASVPAPKTERREIRVLTPAEVQGVADAHPEPYRLVPLLSAWGTFRIGEVGALQVASVDGDRIRVSQSVATAGSDTYLKGPKSKASKRVVQLPGWVMDQVREHILAMSPGETFLFRTGGGNLLSHISYHPIWRRALADCSFPEPRPRPHDLRHTAVALMIQANAHPKQIQARCGHATIKETMDTYGHLFPGHDAELVQVLETFRPTEASVLPFTSDG